MAPTCTVCGKNAESLDPDTNTAFCSDCSPIAEMTKKVTRAMGLDSILEKARGTAAEKTAPVAPADANRLQGGADLVAAVMRHQLEVLRATVGDSAKALDHLGDECSKIVHSILRDEKRSRGLDFEYVSTFLWLRIYESRMDESRRSLPVDTTTLRKKWYALGSG